MAGTACYVLGLLSGFGCAGVVCLVLVFVGCLRVFAFDLFFCGVL